MPYRTLRHVAVTELGFGRKQPTSRPADGKPRQPEPCTPSALAATLRRPGSSPQYHVTAILVGEATTNIADRAKEVFSHSILSLTPKACLSKQLFALVSTW